MAYLLPILTLAAPEEASGVVINVVDGDTFDLRIEKTDPRILYEVERLRLADVDSPEMSMPESPLTKAYTNETLLGKKVWLENINGTINTTYPFNRLLVDAGHAQVDDYTNNEFDPGKWWTEGISEPDLTPAPALTTATVATGGQFVGSTKSNKYHFHSCRWTKKILPENEIWLRQSEI